MSSDNFPGSSGHLVDGAPAAATREQPSGDGNEPGKDASFARLFGGAACQEGARQNDAGQEGLSSGNGISQGEILTDAHMGSGKTPEGYHSSWARLLAEEAARLLRLEVRHHVRRDGLVDYFAVGRSPGLTAPPQLEVICDLHERVPVRLLAPAPEAQEKGFGEVATLEYLQPPLATPVSGSGADTRSDGSGENDFFTGREEEASPDPETGLGADTQLPKPKLTFTSVADRGRLQEIVQRNQPARPR